MNKNTKKPQVLIIGGDDVERRIAARLAYRLAHEELPVMIITDEAILRKEPTPWGPYPPGHPLYS